MIFILTLQSWALKSQSKCKTYLHPQFLMLPGSAWKGSLVIYLVVISFWVYLLPGILHFGTFTIKIFQCKFLVSHFQSFYNVNLSIAYLSHTFNNFSKTCKCPIAMLEWLNKYIICSSIRNESQSLPLPIPSHFKRDVFN